jgi:hypothetical protein
MGWLLDGKPGFGSRQGRVFPLLHSVQNGSGTDPTSSQTGTGDKAYHSLSFSAEDKNGGVLSPLPHMSSWHSVQPIKHRNNFTFTLIILYLSFLLH